MNDLEHSVKKPAARPAPFVDEVERKRHVTCPSEEPEVGNAAARESLVLRLWEKLLPFLVVPERRTLIAWAPVVIPMTILPLLIPLMRLELNEPLFGDTYVFQYTGWCIRHGLRIYQDMGMADGPFIHFLHAVMQMVAGLTERGFRMADLALEAVGGITLGLLLTPKADLSRAARVGHHATWGALGAAIWLSQYLCNGWEATTERETYYALFGSVGMVLLYVSATWQNDRRAAIGTFIGAFLVCSQVFGKPTGIGYVLLGGLSVLLTDANTARTRRVRMRMFAMGALACGVAVLFALLMWGSIRGYFFWCFKIPWLGNRFLFGVSWTRLLFSEWDAIRLMALTFLFVGVAAIVTGILPKRALGLALAPALFWFGACLQARGYIYQAIPAVAASYALALAILSGLWQDCTRPRWANRRGVLAGLAMVFAGQTCIDNYHKSPYRWRGDPAEWKARPHEFAALEQQVGRYLEEHTQPDDRVFAYSAGENAHVVLFYARRRTASPFFHSFWLDPVGLLPQSKIQPGPKDLAALEVMQSEIREVACGAVQENPPAAMAFNLLPQVFKVCPNVEKLIQTHYDEATTIGDYHIYKRKPQHS